ncbi:MAG: hypothetical protein WBM62_00370 [Crocosphaera sp.]
MNKYHFFPEEVTNKNGFITISCTIENPDQTKKQLWYKVPEEYQDDIAATCDPFVVAVIFKLMKQPAPVMIHGQVSPSLLRNLTEYQNIWQLWRPNDYHRVEITGEIEAEISLENRPERAISAFSGGVDSCFTVWQHKKGLCGRWQRNIAAGLMIQGFDIPLSQTNVFKRAFDNSKTMLSSLDIECIPLSTNIRQFGQDWLDSHAAGVASSLMLFQKTYHVGLVPSSEAYDALVTPWGSHPITDPLLSNNTFPIIHDFPKLTQYSRQIQGYN